jgi:hypothetical protein
MVEMGAPPAASGRDAPRDHVDHLVERLTGQVGVGSGLAHQVVERADFPLAGRRHLGHHLLGEDVQRSRRRLQDIEMSGPDPGQERRALDQLVAGEWVEASGGRALPVVIGPPHPLEEGADGPGRPDLAHQLHRSDIDAQLERGGGHQGPQITGPQSLLDDPASGGRQTAMVGGHLQSGIHPVDVGDGATVGPEAVGGPEAVVGGLIGCVGRSQPQGQLMGDPLGHLAGVDEDQRGAVLEYVGGNAVEDVPHLLRAGHRLQFTAGKLDVHVELALVAAVDDGGRRSARINAGEEASHDLQGTLGGRQPDALEPHPLFGGEPAQAFETEGKV